MFSFSTIGSSDSVGFPSLASASYDQGRLTGTHIAEGRVESELAKDIPTGIYTSPEISWACHSAPLDAWPSWRSPVPPHGGILFVNTTFNYPTTAEAYRVAALNGLNRLF